MVWIVAYFHHSLLIEHDLNKMLKRFTYIELERIILPEEVYILLASVYLHDIGYLVNNKIVPEGHEKRSHNLIINNWYRYGINDEREAEAIAKVCYAHANESECSLKSLPRDFGVFSLSEEDTIELAFR